MLKRSGLRALDLNPNLELKEESNWSIIRDRCRVLADDLPLQQSYRQTDPNTIRFIAVRTQTSSLNVSEEFPVWRFDAI